MSAIVLDDVSFSYPKRGYRVQVLSDFSLEAPQGKTVALLGPSGCGKSTVLSLVAGLAKPEAGRVTVLDQELSRMSDSERASFRLHNIAQIYQEFELLPSFTSVENVALLLRLKGLDRREARAIATQALVDVGMENRLGHVPAELSGGEKQRVAIARAVVARPGVLLADEPTGALDAERRDDVLDLMLTSLRGTTTILVTHDPAVAARADLVVQMPDASAHVDGPRGSTTAR